MPTPEQTKANDALEKAVKEVIAAYGIVPEGSLVTDYLVVGEATQFTSEGDDTCDMFIAFRNGHCRLTSALGIFELGRRHLMSHWSSDDED